MKLFTTIAVTAFIGTASILADRAEAEVRICTWNGRPERCYVEETANGQFATVTWLSDGKVTRYDFYNGVVYDTVNGRSYRAVWSDARNRCIATQNGTTCIR